MYLKINQKYYLERLYINFVLLNLGNWLVFG